MTDRIWIAPSDDKPADPHYAPLGSEYRAQLEASLTSGECIFDKPGFTDGEEVLVSSGNWVARHCLPSHRDRSESLPRHHCLIVSKLHGETLDPQDFVDTGGVLRGLCAKLGVNNGTFSRRIGHWKWSGKTIQHPHGHWHKSEAPFQAGWQSPRPLRDNVHTSFVISEFGQWRVYMAADRFRLDRERGTPSLHFIVPFPERFRHLSEELIPTELWGELGGCVNRLFCNQNISGGGMTLQFGENGYTHQFAEIIVPRVPARAERAVPLDIPIPLATSEDMKNRILNFPIG